MGKMISTLMAGIDEIKLLPKSFATMNIDEYGGRVLDFDDCIDESFSWRIGIPNHYEGTGLEFEVITNPGPHKGDYKVNLAANISDADPERDQINETFLIKSEMKGVLRVKTIRIPCDVKCGETAIINITRLASDIEDSAIGDMQLKQLNVKSL